MNRDERMPASPEVYERELPTIPYIKSLDFVVDYVANNAVRGGRVLDLMTGTGFLPNMIHSQRPDLSFKAVDLDQRYVDFGKTKYPEIDFEQGDVLSWKPNGLFEVVMCTGAIHHLPYELQGDFIARIPEMMAPGGFAVLSDCHINDYSNEIERRMAAAKLGYEYLIGAITNGADDEVIRATVAILENDVLMREFKTSVEKRRVAYEKHFSVEKVHKTWPDNDAGSGYGDFVFVLKKK